MAATEAEVQSAQQLTTADDYQFSGNPFTVERKCKFILAMRAHGSIYHAAQVSGCSRRAVYDWMQQDEEFTKAVTDCREDNYDELEISVYQRAFKSDLLAMFYLKAHRPKFRDKVSVDIGEVQERITQMLERLDVASRQLPAAMTSFIDTGYSESDDEYQAASSGTASSGTQLPHQPDNQQKED